MTFTKDYLVMATNDNIYDLAAKLEEDNIEFLLIAVQKTAKDNGSHQATALYNIETVDGCDVIYTTFEEVYEVLLSSDNAPFKDDEDEEN